MSAISRDPAPIEASSFRSTTIGAICDEFGGDVQTGPFGSQLHASDYNEDGIPVVMPQDMVNGRIVCDRIARVSERHVVALKRHKLLPGDLVFSRRGDVTRFALITARESGWLCGTGSIRIRMNSPEVLPEYAKRYLQQTSVGKWLLNEAKGITMPNLNTKIIRALPFVIPPIKEQRRIAAILDQAETLRIQRRAALALLDRLTQSLFLEMFGDPVANPKGWQREKLGNLTSKMGSGSTPSGGDAAYKAEGISLIRSLNVHDGEFKYKNLAYIDETQAAKLSNVQVAEGDVLLNITGASVARVCRAPSDVLPARVNQHVMIVRPKSALNGLFLERMLLSETMKRALLQIGGAGATREAITKAQAEELLVPLPPLPLQQTFAARIQAIEALKATHRQALAALDALFASLQQRAFTGAL